MALYFADTFCFQARVNRHDQHHARVLAWSQSQSAPLVTTELVLVELANSLAASRFRPLVYDYFGLLRQNVTVAPPLVARAWKMPCDFIISMMTRCGL